MSKFNPALDSVLTSYFSFDVVVHHVALVVVQIDIASITNVVGKDSVILLSLSGKLVQQCVTGFSLRDPDSGVEVEDID